MAGERNAMRLNPVRWAALSFDYIELIWIIDKHIYIINNNG
jgi:hypothetical protein